MLQHGTYARERDGGCLLYHSPVQWNDASYALERYLGLEGMGSLNQWRRVTGDEAQAVWDWCRLGPGENIHYDGAQAQREQFTVIGHTAGYLSEDDDPPTFDSYTDAVAYMNERAAEYDDDDDGNYTVEYGWASGDNYAAVVVIDNDKMHPLPYYIEVLRVDDGSES